MRISVGAGTYVLATSGGVDSMVLLDLLQKSPGIKIIVAHYDHGIRQESHLDRQLVQKTAKQHGLKFVYHEGKLGSKTSEAKARNARYEFLNSVAIASKAKAIITAHHSDDLVETAFLNMLRGTGRRGLTSLKSNFNLLRPLLDYEKSEIINYAKNHKILWREDPSNTDTRYTRNYLRHHVVPKLTQGQKSQLKILLNELRELNYELDKHIINLLHTQPSIDVIKRSWFINLPHDIAREVVYVFFRRHEIVDFDRSKIESVVMAIKTAKSGKSIQIDNSHKICISKSHVKLLNKS